LRVRWPAPGVAARDRLTLRAGAVLALFIAVVGSWGDMGPRFIRAGWPSFDDSDTGPTVKVWITPPAYTARSPIFVESPPPAGAQAPGVLEVPENGKILVIVTGTSRPTTMGVNDVTVPLEKLADQSQRLEQDLPRGDEVIIRQRGRVLGAWRLASLPDLPPNISLVRAPREAGRWRLRIDYKAGDDYGIDKAQAHIVLADGDADDDDDGPIEVDLTLPPFNPREAAQASLHDLTAHPWAGRKVLMRLSVTDQAGQSAFSETAEALLPERVFQHPVAKEVIAIRKALLTEPAAVVVPGRRALTAILQKPESFGGDPRVYLELATAKYRLAYASVAESARTLPSVLWAAAVRIEDGNLAVAEQRLDAAERALQDAMERNAPAAEIARLIDELQRAIAEYTKELAARMPEGDMALLNPESDAKTVGPEELAKMMEQLRQMTQMGAQDAARQMMAELQNMLQALKAVSTGANNNPDVKAAQELMRDLVNLTAEQSNLLEDTFKQAREQQLRGQNGEPSAVRQQQTRAGDRQEKLRQELGDLMGRIAEMAGQVPEGMGEAESAMRAARDALIAGAWKPATDAEAEALAQLQDSLQQANDRLMQALAEKGVAGFVPMPGAGQQGNDPLGRRNGPDDGSHVEIPAAPDANSMAERVRAILDEIRRRAADRTRPGDEQDYLRRLMKQF
jgi:uncharacterized protein (TIGR02302 family)